MSKFLMRLFSGPKWQEMLAGAAERAQARSSQLENEFTKTWIEVSSVAGVAAAKALLKVPSRKPLAGGLTDAVADRVLAVVVAEFVEFFTSMPGNLSVMMSWGVPAAADFAASVLSCFDPYGAAVFEVAKNIRVTGDENWGTQRTFTLDRHITIAILSPAEARAFSDTEEALLAGHHLVSKLEDSFVTGSVAIGVYESEFTPQLERRLKAILEQQRARRALQELLWQGMQRTSVREAATRTWATFESMARSAGLWFSQLAESEISAGNVSLGPIRLKENEGETNHRQWRTMFEFWVFNFVACDIHVASLAGEHDRRAIIDAIGDECTQNFAAFMSGEPKPLQLPDEYFRAFSASEMEYAAAYTAAGESAFLNKLGVKVAEVSDLQPVDRVAAVASEIMRQVILKGPADSR